MSFFFLVERNFHKQTKERPKNTQRLHNQSTATKSLILGFAYGSKLFTKSREVFFSVNFVSDFKKKIDLLKKKCYLQYVVWCKNE
ncbi:hypothetical protein ACE6H2_006465 [Prunus campanulata]